MYTKEDYLKIRPLFFAPVASSELINFLKTWCEQQERDFNMLLAILNGTNVEYFEKDIEGNVYKVQSFFRITLKSVIDFLDYFFKVTYVKNKEGVIIYVSV